ncbi:MAG: WG repeat-containing protein, partial [Cytophagaceae bacterium]
IFPSDHKKWVVVSNKKFGLADSTGREILGPKYESIRDLNNGYVIVRKNGKWGVLDYQENFVIPIESDFMGYDPFNNYFFTGIAEKDEILQVKGGGKK